MVNIVSGLNSPHDVLCGPDGRLYVNDLWQRDGTLEVHRILRFNQDGSGRTLVAQWRSNNLRPSAMVFAPNGDLYFGTVSTERGKPTRGIWRIVGALQAESSFNPPEQILSPETFSQPGEDLNSTKPYAFLTAGPFAGDLLIVEKTRILRALKPDFKTVAEFIPAFKDQETGEDFGAGGLAISSQGDVFVNDFSNGKVLRYGPDGTFKGVFAKLETPNQIAIGPDDIVYVTDVSFQPTTRGGLFVFDPEGKPLASANFPIALRGVTVCAPQVERA
jgi:sugar lactone lactonase YvrE